MSRTKPYTVCIYGLEPEDFRDSVDDIKKSIEKSLEKLIKNGFKYFIVGLTRDAGMLAGDILLNLREKYPDIKLVCVDMFKDNHKTFGLKDSEYNLYDGNFKLVPKDNYELIYQRLIARCDLYKCIYDERNIRAERDKDRWLLLKSSVLFAIDCPYLKNKVKNVIKQAYEQKVKVYRINC